MHNIFYFWGWGLCWVIQNHKNLINFCHHQQDFNMDAESIFFATSQGKSPCDGVREFVKGYVVRGSLQRPLHDQILSHQSMLDLCVREIPSLTFFGVSQEYMVNVHADLEDRFAKSKTVPRTKGVVTILYQYLATNLLTKSQVKIEGFFNLISATHCLKKEI